MMELLEHLPKVQPHRLILGQVEAHGGLARCGGNPGLRHSQWLGEGWFSSQLPGFGPGQRNRGAALVSPLSLQARVLVFSGTPTHTHTHLPEGRLHQNPYTITLAVSLPLPLPVREERPGTTSAGRTCLASMPLAGQAKAPDWPRWGLLSCTVVGGRGTCSD